MFQADSPSRIFGQNTLEKIEEKYVTRFGCGYTFGAIIQLPLNCKPLKIFITSLKTLRSPSDFKGIVMSLTVL
ncbi:hypothetical protein J6W20_01195 [bacterium]|nr:hypothetical protein [bacterium]